jgi:tetratricopeptide (TPR) repeat protein
MQSLRITVFKPNTDRYQLRFFTDGNPTPQTRELSASELDGFIARSQAHYQKGLRLEQLGKELLAWLDGAEGFLQAYSKDTVLILDTLHPLGELAWELLHNGRFLCADQVQAFTPLRRVASTHKAADAKNRPLRLLFMASSPQNVEPVLQFEQEEGRILAATRQSNIELVVEESGSLSGLSERLSYGAADDLFDVIHISGHADIVDGVPVFLLEDELGRKQATNAAAIAEMFNEQGRFPRLLFLSGCKTAQASERALPSLCAALVDARVPAVLGWAQPVYDTIASLAAEALYQRLADGSGLERAVCYTRHALYRHEQSLMQSNPFYQPQWHLLRLYGDQTPLTPLVIKGRKRAAPEIHQEFLDSLAKVEVCPRAAFVGRRRLLQQTLRILRSVPGDKDYAEGIILTGMGGLGKSSLALRICQRLAQDLPLRFIASGVLDETVLRNLLGDKLPEHAPAMNDILNQPQPLKARLQLLFRQFEVLHGALFVFDDFEQNFRGGDYQQLEPPAYEIVAALLAVIQQTGSPSRVLLTSRYAFKVTAGQVRLTILPLDSLQGADLGKKTAALRLANHLTDSISAEQEQQAISLAAGNPRLLERLYQVLAAGLGTASLFAQLAAKQTAFREELLLQTLLDYQHADTRQLIACLALFEVFVPKALLGAVMEGADVERHLQAAIAVGLVETVADGVYVSRLLVPLVADILEAEEQQAVYRLAAECLYGLWWESDYAIRLEELWELSRIAKLGGQWSIYSSVTGALAEQLQQLCRYDEAKGLYEALLSVRQELGDRKGESLVYNQMAVIQHLRGDYATALVYFEQALLINRELGDKQGEGTTLNNISQIYQVKGRYDTALRYLEQSLQIRQAIGDRKGEGETLNNIFQIYQVKGDYGTALRYLEQSLHIRQAIGDKQGEGVTLNNISQIYAAKGDYSTALRYLEQSLHIQQAIGDKQSKGTTLNNISQIYQVKGDYGTALCYLEQSLHIRQAIGDKRGEGATLNNISQIYQDLGDYGTALRYMEQALHIRQAIGDKQGEGVTLNNFAITALAKGDYGIALRYLEQALQIQQAIGDSAGECTTLFNMGHIHWQNNEQQQALETPD